MEFLEFLSASAKYVILMLTITGVVGILFVAFTILDVVARDLQAAYLKYFKQYAIHDDYIRHEFLVLSPYGTLRSTITHQTKKLELFKYEKHRLKRENGQETKTVDTTYYAKYKKEKQKININHIDYLNKTPFLVMNDSTILTNPKIVSYEALSTSEDKYVKHIYTVDFDTVVFDFSSTYTSTLRRTFTIIAKPDQHKPIEEIILHEDELEGYDTVMSRK